MTAKRRETILVVDDIQANVLLISKILQKEYNVIQAFSGMEAIEKYLAEKPDLILLDVVMPGIDGYETCRRIKELERNTFTPILFLTAQDDLQSKKEGLMSGAEDFISKPVEMGELTARINAALRTKNLYRQLSDANAEIERERDVIARIQRSLLPETVPDTPGYDFFCDYQPSSKAGGDYYDFIRIDADHLGIIVSDVSGHGTPAAVIMAMTRIVLRAHLAGIHSPKDTLERLNRILCQNIETGDFITAFYAVVNLKTGTMKYASAGHIPPFLAEYDAGTLETLRVSRGFPLMISPNNELEEREARLRSNSKLLIFTDGLSEAMNPGKELFGNRRLGEALLTLGKDRSAEQLGRELIRTIHDFRGGGGWADDYTLLVMAVK
jgi:sigma-B regulation protein RsbU (phosphoserine phosphatase)